MTRRKILGLVSKSSIPKVLIRIEETLVFPVEVAEENSKRLLKEIASNTTGSPSGSSAVTVARFVPTVEFSKMETDLVINVAGSSASSILIVTPATVKTDD